MCGLDGCSAALIGTECKCHTRSAALPWCTTVPSHNKHTATPCDCAWHTKRKDIASAAASSSGAPAAANAQLKRMASAAAKMTQEGKDLAQIWHDAAQAYSDDDKRSANVPASIEWDEPNPGALVEFHK